MLAGVCSWGLGQGSGKSSISAEPEPFLWRTFFRSLSGFTVKSESPIFYQISMDRVLGSMAPGAMVTLVGMSDNAWRVRGRARHGDVAGWMKRDDLVLPDPTLPDKLKAFYESRKQVSALIEAHQVGIGMTRQEVQESLGRPTRTSTRVTASGREEFIEYAIFEKVPQTTIGRAPNGQLVQSVIYVKVEVGTLSISFKNDNVEAIEETKGNPLRGAPIKIVPVPVFVN